MGAGDHLHKLIAEWVGEYPTDSCSCRAFINKMNRDLGWAKKNVQIIVEKLRKEATKRKWWGKLALIPGARKPIRCLVNRAIAMAEADLK